MHIIINSIFIFLNIFKYYDIYFIYIYEYFIYIYVHM
jgi:hypothetical protein